ncbi:MAG: C4-dicarboxylate transporter DctA [Gemmatimonadetes bacterium]|nr:C4-dicarboxylate transporter DctA [Gemmatimonadota bacterium]
MKRVLNNLTFRVLVAVTIGVIFGIVDPVHAKEMKLLGDIFIRLVKMVIGPVIFLTIVLGIANIADLKKVGRVGGKAILYFEIVTTFALGIGLTIVNLTKPGVGLDVSTMTKGDISSYAAQGKAMSFADFLVHVVPESAVKAFADGDILQVVFFSVMFGTAVVLLGRRGQRIVELAEGGLDAMFRVVEIVMKVAPFGAFGAMAYTVGNFGLKTLVPLLRLMGDVYLTMFLFIFVVLNLIMRYFGFSLWQFLKYIRDEILIVLGTSSSEAALPKLMEKLERYGCARPVVGLVVPTGYSFNLDGTSIYLSMATIFLAQVYNVPLTLGQQLTILAVLMVTSKGAAGVTGSGFIVLASTLSAMQVIPLEGLALLLGVDRFMSEARAITNIIGNGVATLVISRSEGAFDDAKREAAVAEMASANLAVAER